MLKNMKKIIIIIILTYNFFNQYNNTYIYDMQNYNTQVFINI